MINNKKIAIDARMIEMSGIGTYIQHFMNKGIYDVALGDEETIHKYDKNIKVIPFDASIYSIKEQLKFPYKKLKKEKIDVIHFPHYNVPLFYRKDFVVTVHDMTHLVFPEFLRRKIGVLYAKLLMGKALRKSRVVYTVSENSKKDILRFFHINPEKIEITYNAIDGSFYEKEKSEVAYLYEKYNIPKNNKIVLYVGNLKAHKNLSRLMEALSKMKEIDDITLLLVGKAFENQSLDEIEDRLQMKKHIVKTGMVESEELVDLYNVADVFAFPSLYEGFGIPPLESMACGTPVVCSNTSSLPEVVGDAAMMFDPLNVDEMSECIRKVLFDADVAKTYIAKGKEHYKVFDWSKAVDVIKETIV